MGGLMSRNKGKEGEREVIRLLQPVVEQVFLAFDLAVPVLQRNTLQSDRGGFDIVGLEWLALEVKRQEQLLIGQWWEQTVRQAGQDKEPVLIYRQNGGRWRVRMWGSLHAGNGDAMTLPVTVAIEDFLLWFRKRLAAELLR